MDVTLICLFAGVCAGIPFVYHFTSVEAAEHFATMWHPVQYTLEVN